MNMMVESKSTDKLLALKAIMADMPMDRIKKFNIIWEEVECVAVPFVVAEFYEEKKDGSSRGSGKSSSI